jgi:hypothetical protein
MSNYSKGALLAISSLFLGDSIRRIRNSIKDVDMAQHINGGIMIAHVFVTVFYLASVVLYYWMFYYVNRNPENIKLNVWGLRAWDISVIVNFMSQLLMCCLFWKLGNKKQLESKPELITV